MAFAFHTHSKKLTAIQVLCRLIDDYLFITTDRQKAKHFYEVMARGMWFCHLVTRLWVRYFVA